MFELSQGIPLATCVQPIDEAESLQSAELNQQAIVGPKFVTAGRHSGPTLLART
jgi:hypothetical protein